MRHPQSKGKVKLLKFLLVVFTFSFLIFNLYSAHAQTLTQEQQLASLSSQLEYLRNLLLSFTKKVFTSRPAAQAIGPASFVTHHDTIPNFAQNHTIQSVANGNWSSASTWNLGRVPNASDIVAISHVVTYDTTAGIADVIGVSTGGILRFRTDINTRLQVGVLLVMPGGVLEVGTATTPVQPTVTAEIVIRNRALGTVTSDPDQYGTGLLSVDGTVTMHGAVKSPTWVRVTQAPSAGATSITLETPVTGWRVGDKFVLPDSRQRPNSDDRITYQQLETRTISSISGDGRTITFSPALTYTHPGTTDENGDGKPDYLPHIANLDRNVIIRSESRTGTRGHALFTSRSAIDLRYAAFEGMGRTTFNDLNAVTNHIGRYSLHMHHLMGPYPTIDPQYQFRLVGNSIYEDAPNTPPQKWGITVHNSHYGLIQDNVVYNLGGAGIVTEDGSESYNVFDHNFVARIASNGGRDEHESGTRGIAREGVGFWFRGPNNYVRNNVAVNMGESTDDVEAAYAFKYNMLFLGDLKIPNFRGADTSAAGQYTTKDGNTLHLLELDNNEGYGLVQGLTIWWHCIFFHDYSGGCSGQTVIRNLTLWHVMRYTYYGYHANNYVFDNAKVYSDPARIGDFGNGTWWYGDYLTVNHILRNSSFYNSYGVFTPYQRGGDFIRFENNHIKTERGVIHRRSAAPGDCPSCDLQDPDTILVNNRYAPLLGRSLRSITMDGDYSTTDPANSDDLIVYDHNGVIGDNFQVYFPQKPHPCITTRPDIMDGYVCPLSGSPSDTTPPTTSLTAPAANTTVAGTVSLTATASDNVGVSRVEFYVDSALKGTDTSSPYSYSWDTTNGGTHPCIGAHTHTLQTRAYDAANNTGTSANVVVNMQNPSYCGSPDTTSPSTPTNLTASAISSSQINLSWTASTDNVAVTGYRVERCQGATCTNFAQIATPTTNSYSDTGLTANTTYRYQVRATDSAGNLSGYSSIASAATLVAPPSVNVDSAANSPDLSNQTSGSWMHTTSGSNRYLLVGLAGWDSADSLANVNVSYAGVSMTKLGGPQAIGNNNAVLWGLINPALGANTISITNIPSGFSELGGGSISFTNVNQTTPVGTLVSEMNGDASVNVALTSGDMGVDILYSGAGTQSPVIGSGGTMRVNRNLTSDTTRWMMMGTEAGSGTVAMSWTDAGGADFGQAAIPLKYSSTP